MKSDPFERKRIDTPEGESETACMNIAAANMTKRVGAFNTIVVWDLTGELVVYQNSHCHVSVQALQDSDKFGGISHFFHDDPQSIAVHRVKIFGIIEIFPIVIYIPSADEYNCTSKLGRSYIFTYTFLSVSLCTSLSPPVYIYPGLSVSPLSIPHTLSIV